MPVGGESDNDEATGPTLEHWRIPSLSLDFVIRLFDDNPGVLFVVKDAALRVVDANAASLQLWGASSVSAVGGLRLSEVASNAGHVRSERLDQLVIQTENAMLDQLEWVATEGSERVWMTTSRWPLTDHAGKAHGLAWVARPLELRSASRQAIKRVESAAAYMEEHFVENIDFVALAERAGCSLSQLCRDFWSTLHITPSGHLAKLRVQSALQLLLSDLPIADVALSCGYSDQSAFARRFRALVGMTPGQYRRTFVKAR